MVLAEGALEASDRREVAGSCISPECWAWSIVPNVEVVS